MKPLRANPGGNVPVDQAIGRGTLCRECWDRLEMQSIRLENERRLGKTTVIRVMVATRPRGTRTIFMEVGGLAAVTDFIAELIREIDNAIPEKGKSFMNRVNGLIGGLAGIEVAGIVRIPDAARKHWRKILMECFDALAAATPDRIVFFWDEMPWMLQRIKDTANAAEVVDLLNTLRDIRQKHDRIRMVFTGSIGFHHVVSALEDDGVGSRPISDMRRINVPPLKQEDGRELAERLLIGEQLEVDDLAATAAALHDLTGGVPFYIHSVVASLLNGGKASVALVEQTIENALLDPGDPWEMRYFDTRLDQYYKESGEIARAVLDALAQAPGPLAFGALHEAVRAAVAAPAGNLDKHAMLKLVTKLMQDHYLERGTGVAGHFTFKFELLRRSWRIQRGIDL